MTKQSPVNHTEAAAYRPRHRATISVTPQQTSLTQGLPKREYRPEIQGVRGLAILGVVLFHLFGNGRISGGVDIFLAVSGFLFTAMLLREAAESGGRVNLGRYFGRLAKRVIPPAVLVVAVTLCLGLALMPSTRQEQLWREARASLLYFENFELINSQLTYGAAGIDTSPFQHFWSLAVQGQFYLIWPLLTILVVLIARAIKRPAAHVMAVAVSLVLVASLAYALYVQSYSQDEAYLLTQTRIWELAFGGLLALSGARLNISHRWRSPIGWLGILLIISCGFVLDGSALFPGLWALWPLIGFALVLFSTSASQNSQPAPRHPATLLARQPFVFIADISYGLYLWHWPLLIFWMQIRNHNSADLLDASIVLVVSVVLAYLTNRWFEQPLAKQKRIAERAIIAIVASCMTIGGIFATVMISNSQVEIPEGSLLEGVDRELYPGALATGDDPVDTPDVDGFIPDITLLPDARPVTYSTGCHQRSGNSPGTGDLKICEDPDAPENPAKRVILTGGSHGAHWHSALINIATAYDWELLVVVKEGCRLGSSENAATNMCAEWNRQFIEELPSLDADMVISTGSAVYREEDSEVISAGSETAWVSIAEAVDDLVLIRGTARPEDNAADCLAAGNSPDQCGPIFNAYADVNPVSQLDLSDNIHSLDLTENICPKDNCPAIIGNIAVYQDSSHLSSYYAESLTPFITEQLRDRAPEVFR